MKAKELTIEEKAKAYDRALANAKEQAIDGYLDAVAVNDIFPELKQSEDDRIREKVIDVLKLNVRGAEAQMQASRGIDRTFEVYACNKVIAWLEKQGELKPVGWSKEDERDFYVIRGIIYNSCNAEDASRLIAWLKAIKDRVVPQPQQQWSEEDEKHLSWLIEHLNQSGELYSNLIDWLKSLRPQSNWRPSDAQMASITCAVRKMKESACYDSELVSLFNDLKKLKG